MRLIDVEDCPCYMCGATCPHTNPIGDCRKFNNWIRKPVYNVDKVISEIDKCSIDNTDWGYSTNPKLASYYLSRTAEVIDIVKRGGVNE